MLKTLISKQFMEFFRTAYVDKKTGKAKTSKASKGLIWLFVAIFAVLMFNFFGAGMGIGHGTLNQGHDWMYFMFMGLIAIVLGVVGSVFSTYTAIYLPKDNEQMLALPIPVFKLLIARSFSVYLMGLAYSASAWLPAIVVYWIFVPVTALRVIIPFIMTFFVALFVFVLTCILGWIVALIATRIKGKGVLTALIGAVILIGYYVVYFKLMNSLSEIAAQMDVIGETVKTKFHYMYFLSSGAAGDVMNALLFMAITLALVVLCMFILSKTFLSFTFTSDKGKARVKAAQSDAQIDPGKALLRREFKQFGYTSAWVFNQGLGLALLPVLGIIALIKSGDIQNLSGTIFAEVPFLTKIVPYILYWLFSWIVAMDVISAVTISIEGKNIGLLRSLPMSTKDVLAAKAKLDIYLNLISGMIAAVLVVIAFRMNVAEAVLFCLAVAAFVFLKAYFGLLMDCKHANLTWTNANTIIKQGFSVTVSLFSGWGFIFVEAIIGVGISLFLPGWVGFAVLTLVNAALALHFRHKVYTVGAKRFEALS